MKIIVEIPDWEFNEIVKHSMMKMLKEKSNDMVVKQIEKQMKERIFEKDFNELIREGTVTYLEKYKIRDIIKSLISGRKE